MGGGWIGSMSLCDYNFHSYYTERIILSKTEKCKWEHIHKEVCYFILSTADMGDTVRIEDPMNLMMKIFMGDNLFDLEPSLAKQA